MEKSIKDQTAGQRFEVRRIRSSEPDVVTRLGERRIRDATEGAVLDVRRVLCSEPNAGQRHALPSGLQDRSVAQLRRAQPLATCETGERSQVLRERFQRFLDLVGVLLTRKGADR